MKIITFANQKGGVGKTMTVAATASILSQEGHRVLMIDLDAQRNLDMVAGYQGQPSLEIQRNDLETLSIYHVLTGKCSIREAIVTSAIGDLVRASNLLYSWVGNLCLLGEEFLLLCKECAEMELLASGYFKGEVNVSHERELIQVLHSRIQRLETVIQSKVGNSMDFLRNPHYDYFLLKQHLKEVENDYDFILLDTNPSLTLLTMNALFASHFVLIPTYPEDSSIEAILELHESIYLITQEWPQLNLEIAGILVTKYSPFRKKSLRHDEIFSELIKNQMNEYLFETKIRETEAASSYVEANLDVIRHAPTGNTALDYRKFVEELKIRISYLQNIQSKKTEVCYG